MVYPYEQQPLSNEAISLTNDLMPTDLRTHNTLDSNSTNLRTQQETASDLQLCLSDENFMFSNLGMSPPQNQPLNFSQVNSHGSQIVQELQNAVLEDLAVPSQNAQVYEGQMSQTSSGLPGVSRQNDQWSQLLQGSDTYQEQDKNKQTDLQTFFNNDLQSLYQQKQQKQLKDLNSKSVKKEPVSPSLALQSDNAALKKVKKTTKPPTYSQAMAQDHAFQDPFYGQDFSFFDQMQPFSGLGQNKHQMLNLGVSSYHHQTQDLQSYLQHHSYNDQQYLQSYEASRLIWLKN